MLPEWTVVGFSGHRKLAGLKAPADGIRNALDRLAAGHSPLAAVSSAASGSDTLFVQDVARRHLPYLLVLPFPRARFEQDFSAADWQQVVPLIDGATRVLEVTGEDTDKQAYMEAGIMTVERADVMMVVWDGKPAAGLGGTGDVVAYARKLEKPLIIIHPDTAAMVEERLERLPAKSGPAGWKQEEPRELVKNHQSKLDADAIAHAPGSRHLILRIILVQLIAAAVGLTALVFENHESRSLLNPLSTVAELLLLGAAFFWSVQHRRKHHEWIKNRIAAEICRSFLAMWDMGRRADYFPKISVQGYDRLCRNLRLIRTLDQTAPPALDAVRAGYLKERVGKQIAYFSRYSRAARRTHRKLKWLALACTAAAAVLSLLSLVLLIFKDAGAAAIPIPALTIPKYLSLLLPLVSTALISLLVTQDYSRRAVRYAEMAAALAGTARQLKLARTWNSLARIASETEAALLQEIVEWHSFRQFAGEPG